MFGNKRGCKHVSERVNNTGTGFTKHIVMTGITSIYEGNTIATIEPSSRYQMEPIIFGSAGNLVTAAYNQDGKRLIFDGGYTRLFCNWDTAGTERYVINAATWLVNFENNW